MNVFQLILRSSKKIFINGKSTLLNNLVLILFIGLNYNLNAQSGPMPVKGSQIKFVKHILHSEFIAEGVAVGDVNQDGLMDVISGAFWFESPTWKKHELAPPKKFEFDKGYSDSFASHAMDVNHDGWIDFVRIGFPGKEIFWFENPKNNPGHWKAHEIHPPLGNESAGFFDLDGDGKMEILGGDPLTGEMVWLKAPSSKNKLEWEKFTISKKDSPGTANFSHGLGIGDMNNNDRMDVIITEGWWEAPANPKQPDWIFHSADLGEASAQMFAYDFNGNGLKDVLSSSAHALGIWWHEQGLDEEEMVSWTTNLIDDRYTQTHAMVFLDVNSNGYPDFITGKRYFAHQGKDLGGLETPYLYWYEFVPGTKPSWIPHRIDDDSGVGVQIVAEDINQDGLIDIIVANKKGVFVFVQERK